MSTMNNQFLDVKTRQAIITELSIHIKFYVENMCIEEIIRDWKGFNHYTDEELLNDLEAAKDVIVYDNEDNDYYPFKDLLEEAKAQKAINKYILGAQKCQIL